jgi:hypothetical protein
LRGSWWASRSSGALEAALEPCDERELGVEGEAEEADLRGLGGGNLLVELLYEADESVRAFPVEFIELLTGEQALRASGEGKGLWER